MASKTKSKPNWFDTDREGLAKSLEKNGKSFVIKELIQNAWDEDGVTTVTISLEPILNKPSARLIVEDDSPIGFQQLAHCYTLFAESAKKFNPKKRGRYNFGEKRVLAMCEEATISSTTGTVHFDNKGRHLSNIKLEKGSRFEGIIRMTRDELSKSYEEVKSLIPPEHIITTFNGCEIKPHKLIHRFKASLPTEIAEADGILKVKTDYTLVSIYEVLPGEEASLYEMGIAVVETGDKWHVDIGQKVPLNMDRDNVRPAFLKTVRTLVVNEMHSSLSIEDANASWVRVALPDPRCSDEAIKTVIKKRFGNKYVIYDPSDPEANKIALSKGYTIIPSRALNHEEWKNVRRAKAALPAGKVTPSPKPFSENGRPLKMLPTNLYTSSINKIVAYAKDLAKELLKVDLSVEITNDEEWKFNACYERKNDNNARMILSLVNLKSNWFDDGITENVNRLLIHEFGHHSSSDHYSHTYHDALCRLGAKLALLALKNPAIFQR